MMEDIGRINLSFNLNDPKAKAVYEYLKRANKSKSSTVIEAVSKTFLSEFYWENYILERECALAEKVIEYIKNTTISVNNETANLHTEEILCQISQKIDTLIDNIGKTNYQPTTSEEKQETPSDGNTEINEDAFNSMMSMISDF